jgi:LPPG:FO 2-phospho-L-lactate transferase
VRVVVLAGGTGGAKLARGLLDVCDLTVVANTGDDVEAHGALVSPDPDLVAFWLADRIDERGWGLEGDTFHAMDQLRELGEDVWFELGDRDLAIGLWRAARLRAGARPTDVHADLVRSLGIEARVLPMCDEPVRTRINGRGLQEHLIHHAADEVRDLRFDGIAGTRPTPEVLAALAAADAIVVGPSNPAISIGPILAVPGMREAIGAAPAPVVMVSPLVGGQVLKGPTAQFLRFLGRPRSASGVAAHYGPVLDGVLADEPVPGLPHRVADVGLGTPEARRRVAEAVLDLAAAL